MKRVSCRTWLNFALVTVVIFTSCQKELSIEGANIPPPPPTNLLIKTVAVTGNDSLVTLYTYDNLGQLITETIDGIAPSGQQLHSFRKYERDAAGRLSRILYKEVLSGVEYDTVRTVLHYPDPVKAEFDYAISTQNYFGYPIIDSLAFNYSGNNMTDAETFTDVGMGYTLSERQEFEFNGQGNVILSRLYSSISSPDGSLLYTSDLEYSYGDEPDYTWTTGNAAQNYWFAGLPNAAHANIAHLEVKDQTGMVGDLTISTELELGDNDKPATGVSTIMPYNIVTDYTFYYN